jgi:hypothetical protein
MASMEVKNLWTTKKVMRDVDAKHGFLGAPTL